jgi:membrane protein
MTARTMLLLSILRRTVRNFYADSCLDLAAAVAFYSLLSMGPVIYLGGATLGWFFKNRYSTSALLEGFSSFVPPEVVEALNRVNLGVRTETGLVVIALPALLWGALRGFTAIGRALNRAFGATRRRANWLARVKALAILGAGLLLLGVAILASSLLPQFSRFLEDLGLPEVPTLFQILNTFVVSPLISFVIFTLFYKFLPHGRVSWRPALFGALLAVVLWEGARSLFSQALAYSHSFGLLSGTVAGVVAFLLWTYTGMVIILIGAELAAVLNGRADAPRLGARPEE